MRKLLIALGYRPLAPEAVVAMDLKLRWSQKIGQLFKVYSTI